MNEVKQNVRLGFCIGSDVCPGFSKLVEEAGEVMQVVGKLVATGGSPCHWDGTENLWTKLTEELADLSAAIDFVVIRNGLDVESFLKRTKAKLELFEEWHHNQRVKNGDDVNRPEEQRAPGTVPAAPVLGDQGHPPVA